MSPIASSWIARHPFLLVGLITPALVIFVESGLIATDGDILAAVLRVLIIPFYLVWLALTILQVQFGAVAAEGVVLYLKIGVTCLVGIMPHLLADKALRAALRPRDLAAWKLRAD
jgi:hypothetical protein